MQKVINMESGVFFGCNAFRQELVFDVKWVKIKETEERGNEEMGKSAGGFAGNGAGTVMRAELWA